MFWGATRLGDRLNACERVKPFCKHKIDGASYRLSIGHEVYVSPTGEAADASTTSITHLKSGEAFAIPPGQFAFLLTDEQVQVREKEIAFISMRASTKYRGLVSASGFHVDPNFHGRLTFAVFNAGPVAVHLRQDDDIFLIWFADLTDPGTKRHSGAGPFRLKSEWISGISGKLYSLTSLANAVDATERRLERRLDAVTRELAIFRVVAAIAVTALFGLGFLVLRQLGAE